MFEVRVGLVMVLCDTASEALQLAELLAVRATAKKSLEGATQTPKSSGDATLDT